jgi:adenylosuccinate lyase
MRMRPGKLMRASGLLASILMLFGAHVAAAQTPPRSVEDLFTPEHQNQLVLEVEAAIAVAQAAEGVIPDAAAREIMDKANIRYTPIEEVRREYAQVRHRMVAILNVWKRSMSKTAADHVHYGVTTVDVYDTVLTLQIRASIRYLIDDLRIIEGRLLSLAEAHRDTPMIGRTLGQHALPITFGKKVAVWASVNRRNIDRLKEVAARIERLGVLKGAVGTHLGLGARGAVIERRVASSLGLSEPDPADWHGARDVYAEYAQVLALIAKSNAAIGEEVFRLQMTDIDEVSEGRPETAVGSSTMPHKANPSRSEALIHHGRTIPRLAEVLLDDVVNAFERDNTSRPNEVVEEITIAASDMLSDAKVLLQRLEINKLKMRANLDRTGGLIMSQRIVFHLSNDIGRERAEEHVRVAAALAAEGGASFRAALLADPAIGPLVKDDIDALLDPTTYLGLAGEQVDQTVALIRKAQGKDKLAN